MKIYINLYIFYIIKQKLSISLPNILIKMLQVLIVIPNVYKLLD